MNTEAALGYLRLIAPNGVERIVTIAHTPFCIGRGPHNELKLTDQSISRHHACLSRQGDKFQVVDVGSENGTWIGETRLETNQPYTLDYNEVFRVGPYQLRLEPAEVATRSATDETMPIATADLVAAESASGSAPPIEPLGEPFLETSPDKHLGVVLRTSQIAVLPGHTANVSLVVVNQNQHTDWFRVTLAGLPDVWLAAPPPLIELSPQARQEVNLTIQPSLSSDSRAGQYRLMIQVTSQNHPTEAVTVHANLTVETYAAFDSRLSAPRLGVNDVAQVIVRNEGNAAQTFTVTWLDPEERYEFRPAETQTVSIGWRDGRRGISRGAASPALVRRHARRRLFDQGCGSNRPRSDAYGAGDHDRFSAGLDRCSLHVSGDVWRRIRGSGVRVVGNCAGRNANAYRDAWPNGHTPWHDSGT